MSTIFSAPAAARGIAGSSWASGLAATLERWWMAYLTRRLEQAAIAQLRLMSDRELKDMGLIHCDITGAVRGEASRDRAFSRYH